MLKNSTGLENITANFPQAVPVVLENAARIAGQFLSGWVRCLADQKAQNQLVRRWELRNWAWKSRQADRAMGNQ